MIDHEQQRDHAEESYNDQLMHDYAEIGFEYAQSGRSRRMAQRWCKLHTTIAQERDFWKGFAAGEVK